MSDETQPPSRRPMRLLLVTLDGRTASGDEAERSGLRLRELLDDYSASHGIDFAIEQHATPAEAEPLRKEILRGWEAGADVIFTIGGTGLGPRDIAPDVVVPLCDRLLPGVVEHIRTKLGASDPHARLSRAVAGVIGTTQIYTLPGSESAAEEYLLEIVVTLGNIAGALRGGDPR